MNVHRVHLDLREVKEVVNKSNTEELWIRELFSMLISGLIVMRFVLCFLGLAANIVSMSVSMCVNRATTEINPPPPRCFLS